MFNCNCCKYTLVYTLPLLYMIRLLLISRYIYRKIHWSHGLINLFVFLFGITFYQPTNRFARYICNTQKNDGNTYRADELVHLFPVVLLYDAEEVPAPESNTVAAIVSAVVLADVLATELSLVVNALN